MAETTNRDEATFEAKRKPDPCCEAKDECPNKIQKLEVVGSDSCHTVKSSENGEHDQDAEHIDDNSLHAKGKNVEVGADVDAEEADADEDDYQDEDDDEDDEDEYDSGDGEKSSRKVAGDRKGKGILKDVKGKGKLIEEDDDDDSSDGGSELDSSESDLSDDPLAEVDLDNILPSRTRRRTVHPGVYIAKDLGNEDDDSNDSDA